MSKAKGNLTQTAFLHLPGLFEFYDLYKVFLPLFFEHREYFYAWCEIGSVYGAPADCLWGGGRVGFGDAESHEVIALMREYGISARLTFSNSLLENKHLDDRKCNKLLKLFSDKSEIKNGVIVHSDLLIDHIKNNYPDYYLVSSTTKVITDFNLLKAELDKPEFEYVVPDFRFNRSFENLKSLSDEEKHKVEFLCNECCYFGCKDRKACYENVSRKSLGETLEDHKCNAPDSAGGYSFSKAMKNPGFISRDDIEKIYMPMGFNQFKIEGRSLGSAMVLEFLLYYMTKPEYQINVREHIYLDNVLDLF